MTPHQVESLHGKTLSAEDALALAFRAGEAHRTGSHRDFAQIHLNEAQTIAVLLPRLHGVKHDPHPARHWRGDRYTAGTFTKQPGTAQGVIMDESININGVEYRRVTQSKPTLPDWAQKLVEARARGAQLQNEVCGIWMNELQDHTFVFDGPPESYRIQLGTDPAELPPEVPSKGSYWRYTDGDIYIALPCDGRFMANGWRLVRIPSGDSWMPTTGWDGDRANFTRANPPDLSGC